MISKLIEWSANNRFIVFLLVAILLMGGILSMKKIPLDAIPDLSDVQVIVYTKWEGRSPDLMEDQITYPIITALISAPKVKTVRGFSDLGFSYVYVIFEEGTDLYWARSRVLEYMQQIGGKLPEGVTPTLGPDATGVGWVYQYTVTDRTGKYDLADLRTLQDWFLRYQLASIEGVAEVASIGGFVKQYQVNVDPNKLAAYRISIRDAMERIRMSNNDVEGRLLEFAGREYMVRGRGYIKSIKDIEDISLGSFNGVPISIKDVAKVNLGPEMRRGIVELNGEGEVVGGIVVMRQGENALNVINRVKEKLKEIEPSLPEGVKVEAVYDRSQLIQASITNLKDTLIEEVITLFLIVIVFLLHGRSSIIPIITIPIVMIGSFLPLYFLKISSNIMSLGGIALAIGELGDAAIVMVENSYRLLSEGDEEARKRYKETCIKAAKEIGPAIFSSLWIIIVSFIPIFLLEAQEGRLFKPLAYTKTIIMIVSALLAVTLVPALLVTFMNGKKLKRDEENPLSRFFTFFYMPVIKWVLKYRKTTLAIAVIAVLPTVPLFYAIGSEFMPPLYEGTILYMPVTAPGLSVTEAGKLLQAQDRLIKSVPEVEHVFGKAGRAETSTDPAPFSMMETVVHLKPKEQWREGMTYEKLLQELDEKVQFPGVSNAWTQPIRARIDMLTTGIRTPVGIKIAGTDLKKIQELGKTIEMVLKDVKGTRSVYAERVSGGYFVDIKIKREEAARYGLTVGEIQDVVQTAIGGMQVTTTVEGRERYPVNIRYQRELRDDVDKLNRILVPTMNGMQQIPLAQVADISLTSGPAMIRDEDGLLSGYVYIDVTGRDIGGYVDDAKAAVREKIKLPPGYALSWSGQYEFQVRAKERMKLVMPVVFLIIFIVLYMTFGSFAEALIVIVATAYAMTGGLVLQYILGYNFSVAVWVGYITVYGVAVMTGVMMMVFLNDALKEKMRDGREITMQDIYDATIEGSVKRLRPKLMTVATTMIGLIPIMWSSGVGADVMKPIAAPIIGGMVTSTIQVLIITPVIFIMMKERALRKGKL
ncbi:MAG: CusA/CzcA family heavy metal efflux RND transporter [Deltaproteobacteria bacterium]|nr:CusA/CzcA family heavy metal efflux RND transporter [Deltaproteobacteria bacterium]